MDYKMIQIVGALLFCFVTVYVIFDFLGKMHQHIYPQKYIYVITYVGFSCVLSVVNYANMPLLNIAITTVLTGMIGYFLYTGGTLGLLYNEIFVLCLAFCEEIAVALVSLLYLYFLPHNFNTFYRNFLDQSLSLIIIIAAYRLFIILIRKIHVKHLSKLQYIFFFLFPIFSIVDIIALTTFSSQSTFAIILILFTVCAIIALNLFIAYLFEFISKSNELQNDLNLFQQQANIQYDYYNNLEKKFQQSRKLQHDIRNHLQMLEQLYKSDEKQMADQYTKNIYEMIDTLGQKYFSDNKALNIIINDKLQLAEAHQIQFECKIDPANIDFIEPIDLTIIFANLLDNAIEGCKKANGKRFIKIIVKPFHDFVNIHISNSYSGERIKKGDKFISTKASHEGIGLPNVENTVEKYGGNMMVHTEQNIFKVNVIIPISSENLGFTENVGGAQ